MVKTVSILGSTGSIGTQSLEVISEKGGFSVLAISGNSNIELLEKQVREYCPKFVAVPNEEKAEELNYVIVGGEIAVKDATATGIRAGRLVRRER